MKRFFFLAAAFSLPFCAYADKAYIKPHPDEEFFPWFTGPLLAPAAIPVPAGHYDIEPYLYATARTGFYNPDWRAEDRPTFWNLSSQTLLEFGLTSFMDFEMLPIFNYNLHQGAADWSLGDWEVLFNFQLYKNHFDIPGHAWNTALKLSLTETLPLGKYRNLKPSKRGTDLGGQGSWQTSVGLIWGNDVHVTGHQFFNARLSLLGTYLTPVHVKGFNVYGGGYGADGTVTPGFNFQADLGMEYALTQNWVLALDILGIWQGSSPFEGTAGVDLNGQPASSRNGSQAQFSLAPAIEYNWSENLGLIAGSWFTVAGRNISRFASGVVAVNYYH